MANREDNRLNWIFQDIARERATIFNELIDPHGIVATQAWIIGALSSRPGATQSELAALLRLTRAAIGNSLDSLEEADLIERRADEQDRRVWRVYLTPKARPLRRFVATAAAKVNEIAFEGLNQKERAQLIALLQRVRTNLETRTTDAEDGKISRERTGTGFAG